MKKNFLYFFISSILSAGLGFVIAIYLGHVLEPQEYGYLGIFAMVLYLVEPMIAFFSFGLLEINKITLSSANYEIFKKKTINLGIVNTIVTMFIVFFISFFYPNHRTLLLFIPFLALSRLFLRIKWIELIQEKKAKEYALLFSLVSIAMAVLTLVLISGLGMNWEGRILAMVLAEYSIAWFLYKNYNFEIVFFKKQEFTEVFKFGLPLFVALGAAWLLQESDKFIVLKYFDLSAVGIYTFAYMIGRAMQIFNQAFLKMLRPYYYKLLHKGQMTIRFHLKYVFLYALLILLCATLLSVLLNYFREPLLPIKYQSGYEIIIIIFYAFGFYGIYQITSLIIEFYKKNIEKTIVIYIAALVNIIISIVLIDKNGVLAPAYGTLIGFIVLFLMSLFFSIMLIKEKNVF